MTELRLVCGLCDARRCQLLSVWSIHAGPVHKGASSNAPTPGFSPEEFLCGLLVLEMKEERLCKGKLAQLKLASLFFIAASGEGQDAFSQAAECADCPGLLKAAAGKNIQWDPVWTLCPYTELVLF